MRAPALAAGAQGLAGIAVTTKTFEGAVTGSFTVPAVNPGDSRAAATYYINNPGSYYVEFARVENPTAPGAPAPLDTLRFFFA